MKLSEAFSFTLQGTFYLLSFDVHKNDFNDSRAQEFRQFETHTDGLYCGKVIDELFE